MESLSDLEPSEFESLLQTLCNRISEQCQRKKFERSATFEKVTRETLQDLLAPYSVQVNFEPHPYVFPDIVLGKYGIEVKFTTNDTWRSVANSIFESTRSQDEMRKAAAALEDALFVEYWGMAVPPEDRIKEWLRRADMLTQGWKPSATLFLQK